MKIIKILTAITGFLFLISCSDGIQVEQKVKELIQTNKIEIVTISGNRTVTNAVIDSVKFQNQIMQIGNKYYNLGEIVSIQVNEKTLNLNF